MNKDELLSLIDFCKSSFEQIKNNSENENYVFKRALRAINEIDECLNAEQESEE